MSDDKEYIILKVAEAMIRQGGYNSFSFRNIATEVGIKSSSVHHHFSTKEDLGVAVTRYYTDAFLNSLGSPINIIAKQEDPIDVYIRAFNSALNDKKGMCLCGILGAEVGVLPERVAEQTRSFFQRNIEWLSEAYRLAGQNKRAAYDKAVQVLCLLEGMMLTSNAMADKRVFDSAIKIIKHI